jgi:hypothetical protein
MAHPPVSGVLGEPVIGPSGTLRLLAPELVELVPPPAPVPAPPLPPLELLPPFELPLAPPGAAPASTVEAPPAPAADTGASLASVNEQENCGLHVAPALWHLQSAAVLHQPSDPRDLLPGS